MSILSALYTGIYSKLSAGTALTNLLGGTAIYHAHAPDDKDLPYVVFSLQAGGPLLVNPSDMQDHIIWVRAYAATDAGARAANDQISALLHQATLTISGYTNLWTVREEDIDGIEEPPTGAPIYMAGGMYRIKTDA